MKRRRWDLDLALTLGALAAQLAPFLFVRPETADTAWNALGYVAVVTSAVPVLFRRFTPVCC